MKKLMTILFAVMAIALTAKAQIVQPVKWAGVVEGDSVKLTATIEKGWHLNIIELGEGFYIDEYEGTFTETVAKADTIRVRYNACDDKMCTAPESWEYVIADNGDRVSDNEEAAKSVWWIFVMGLLGGLLAIFTPCVWPIIPMTVSFFIKRGGAAKGTTNATVVRDAILYGLSIVIIYVGLGLLVTLVFGASALNALSTNAVVNIIFFLILVLFAASFFGAFEITLPSSWSTALNSKSSSTTGFLIRHSTDNLSKAGLQTIQAIFQRIIIRGQRIAAIYQLGNAICNTVDAVINSFGTSCRLRCSIRY